jgi:hypothetical protein
MRLIIRGLTIPDKKLLDEITEIVRQTSPELFSRPRHPPGRRLRSTLVAGLIVAATAGLAAGARTASHAATGTRSTLNHMEMSSWSQNSLRR